jgi:hypothetical protein
MEVKTIKELLGKTLISVAGNVGGAEMVFTRTNGTANLAATTASRWSSLQWTNCCNRTRPTGLPHGAWMDGVMAAQTAERCCAWAAEHGSCVGIAQCSNHIPHRV